METNITDYNLRAKVIFTAKHFIRNHNKCEIIESNVFTIGFTEWSIKVYKEEKTDKKYYLSVYLMLKKSLQNTVKAYADFYVKDYLCGSNYLIGNDFLELNKENKSWGLKVEKTLNTNRFKPNDCLTICIDIKVDEQLKRFNNKNFNFESVFNDRELNDFKVIVNGNEYFVSKAILSSRSPVFQSMFCNDMKEKNESQCVIEDIDVDVFEEFLNFIYSGKLSKIEIMADKLLDISDRFQVKELVTICEQLLIFDLNINNALNSLIIADKHNCIELKTKALKYVLKNISKFKTNNLETFVGNYKQLTIEMLKLGELLSKNVSEDTLEVFSYSLS